MNRFFKRNGLNQFDFDSLEEEADRLYEEIKELSKEKNIPIEDWVLVGYSNGANIAAHLLLERETNLTRGIFFHPMSLERHTKTFSLADKKVWLSLETVIRSLAMPPLMNWIKPLKHGMQK